MSRPLGHSQLGAQMQLLRENGYHSIVSTLEIEEARSSGLAQAGAVACRHGLTFTQFPIPDYSVPSSVGDFLDLTKTLYVEAMAGQHIVVHCFGGIGRSALVVTGMLIRHGLTPEQAIKQLSGRGGITVPETVQQKRWLLDCPIETL